jgi:hypothetical protein
VGRREDPERLRVTSAICHAQHSGYTATHEMLLRTQMVHDSELDESLIMNSFLDDLPKIIPKRIMQNLALQEIVGEINEFNSEIENIEHPSI